MEALLAGVVVEIVLCRSCYRFAKACRADVRPPDWRALRRVNPERARLESPGGARREAQGPFPGVRGPAAGSGGNGHNLALIFEIAGSI